MKTKYVEPVGYISKEMEKAFKAAKKESKAKSTTTKGQKKSTGKKR